jgi:ABC-type glycerol-3-phosphate transport system permease component
MGEKMPQKKPRRRIKSGTVLTYLVLAVGAFFALVPFLWMISTSLMSLGEALGVAVIPSEIHWENYLEAWNRGEFTEYFVNSIYITLITLAGELTFSILAAYAFARMKFPGRNLLFGILLSTMMIPGMVNIIPNFLIVTWIGRLLDAPGAYFIEFVKIIFALIVVLVIPRYARQYWEERSRILEGFESFGAKAVNALKMELTINRKNVGGRLGVLLTAVIFGGSIYILLTSPLAILRGEVEPLGWINNWPALTIPFMGSVFSVFLLRQFFSQIPDELFDAARIDGAGHLRFLIEVVLPLSKAPIMVIVVLSFIGSWNALAWPLLVTNTPDWRPIAVGLLNFVTEAGQEINLTMAGAFITIIPILLIYFLTQKQFTESIARSGLKG